MKAYNEIMYSRTSTGAINEWTIEVAPGVDGSAIILTRSGLFDGIKTPNTVHITEGKNLGRSNETTPLEQAISEAQSKVSKQRKKGYKTLADLGIKVAEVQHTHIIMYTYNNITADRYLALDAALPKYNTDDNGNIKPMKAQQYWKTQKQGGVERLVPRIKFPCIGQPKINGVRCFMRWVEDRGAVLYSKMGLEYNLPHITNGLTEDDFWHNDIQLIFDGELYIHNEYLSEIRSAVVKPNLKTHLVELRVFDLAIPNVMQKGRIVMLKDYQELSGSINILLHYVIRNNAEAEAFCKSCINAGYEGAIFRDMSATYTFGKRPMTMVKMKQRESAEFLILDIISYDYTVYDPTDGTSNVIQLAKFVCRNDINHETFTVMAEGGFAINREYYENKHNYIGKMLTVEFYERTVPPKELPFHTVGIAVRDYE